MEKRNNINLIRPNDEDKEVSLGDEYRGLWAAMLDRAIRDYITESIISGYSLGAQKETEKWFLSKNEAAHSFLWICAALNIDKAAVWKVIQTKRKQIKGQCDELLSL